MKGERRIELEESASGNLSLVIRHEDGGLDQVMLTKEEQLELYEWLDARRSAEARPHEVTKTDDDLGAIAEATRDMASKITDADDPLGTQRGSLIRAAAHMDMARADLVMLPLSAHISRRAHDEKPA